MSYTPHPTRYQDMKYSRCGSSGLQLPWLSLGLWHNFGGFALEENARAMIRLAFDSGITHFDLANNYGPPPGSAEECFGRILHKDFSLYRDEMVLSTKAGYRMWDGPYGEWGSRKYLISSLDQSLQRMGVDYVDIFYHHRPDFETPLEETMGALDTAVRSGKALYVGISSYDPQRTKEASRILREMGTPCLIHQPSYSMLNRWVEDGLLDVLREEGMGAIAFSPLSQGLLSQRYLKGIPEDSRAKNEHGFLQKEQVEKSLPTLLKLNEVAQARGQTLAQMALIWVMRHAEITSVLIGASSVEQIKENLLAWEVPDFSQEELDKIDSILS